MVTNGVRGCYWRLVDKDQGCCYTSYSAQIGLATKKRLVGTAHSDEMEQCLSKEMFLLEKERAGPLYCPHPGILVLLHPDSAPHRLPFANEALTHSRTLL